MAKPLERFGLALMQDNLKKGKAPELRLFAEIDALLAEPPNLKPVVLTRAVAVLRARLAAAKRQDHQLSFDDLLGDLDLADIPPGGAVGPAYSQPVSVATLIDKFQPRDQYVGLAPWVWVQLESNQPPGPFPFIGGVAPEVVASLHEAHEPLSCLCETAISDVFSRRATLGDPQTRVRLEDAYAELVNSRQQLSQHITARRQPDGQFHWSHPFDATKS